MAKRIVSLVVGLVLGLFLATAVITNAETSEPQVNPLVDLEDALDFVLPVAAGNEVFGEYYAVRIECCDCALVHRVVMFVVPDGLRMLWWREEQKTRMRRRLKFPGFDQSAPFSAERGSPYGDR